MKSMQALPLALVVLLQAGCAQAKPPSQTELVGLIKAGKSVEFQRRLASLPPATLTPVGRTALMGQAIVKARLAAIDALLNWGVDPNEPMPFPMQVETLQVTPLLYAISARAGLPVVSLLVRRGANPNQISEDLQPLHFAMSMRQYEVANYLLDEGALAKAVDGGTQMTALMTLVVAAEDGDPAAIALAKRLIQAGADVNARAQGATALRLAVLATKPGLVNLLLAARADPNAVNDKGESVLQLAVRRQLADIASQLQAAGARP